ncbi:hypothetical protein [Actinomadura rupiterrae]|uniref:hypothetical protein n=1 Tax=Actinomadura rupiterrae TaxID=559627 RepID=UPI0020A254B0|nr:hypothetical protein [Actinomadura rupiterrae]MCP2338721.1 hypothetical protein [Actinomadura rupiterrae]
MGVPPLLGAAAAALSLTTLVAGCRGGDESSHQPQPLTSQTLAMPFPSTTPSPTGTPSPGPADGANLAACREGRCEVRVRAGDQIELAQHFEAGPLVITDVTPEHVSMRWTFTGGGMGAGDAGPQGTIMFGGGGTMLTVHIVRIAVPTATLRLSPGGSGPEPR